MALTRHELIRRVEVVITEVTASGRSTHTAACVVVGEFERYIQELAAEAAVAALYYKDDDDG